MSIEVEIKTNKRSGALRDQKECGDVVCVCFSEIQRPMMRRKTQSPRHPKHVHIATSLSPNSKAFASLDCLFLLLLGDLFNLVLSVLDLLLLLSELGLCGREVGVDKVSIQAVITSMLASFLSV